MGQLEYLCDALQISGWFSHGANYASFCTCNLKEGKKLIKQKIIER
jgi:hypothetical protein